MAKKRPTPPSLVSARDIAVDCLRAFEQDHIYIQDNLAAVFTRQDLDPRERPLAHELACGACRRLITLDHLIGQYSQRPLRRVDRHVLGILRVALYQMLYLTATPDFAAVSEAVAQGKAYGGLGVGGFVNGILRSIQRDIAPNADPTTADPRRTLPLDDGVICFTKDILPPAARNLAKYLGLAYGHPRWLVERWLQRFGEAKLRQILTSDNARPPLTLRVNRLRTTCDDLLARFNDTGIAATPADYALQLSRSGVPTDLPGWEEGHFTVQDAAAMKAAPLLAPQKGQRILDLCAAPGGKTTHLAELIDDNAGIVACDLSPDKLARIQENAQRLGLTSITTCLADALDDHIAQHGRFDAILVDAPCSNSGVLARRVEARHLLRPTGIQQVAQTQRQLLERALEAAKPGTRVLYSTCSIEPAENERLIQAFLADHPELTLCHEELTLPQCLTPPQLSHDGGYLALLQLTDQSR